MGQFPPKCLIIGEVASSEGDTGPDREDSVLQGLLIHSPPPQIEGERVGAGVDEGAGTRGGGGVRFQSK